MKQYISIYENSVYKKNSLGRDISFSIYLCVCDLGDRKVGIKSQNQFQYLIYEQPPSVTQIIRKLNRLTEHTYICIWYPKLCEALRLNNAVVILDDRWGAEENLLNNKGKRKRKEHPINPGMNTEMTIKIDFFINSDRVYRELIMRLQAQSALVSTRDIVSATIR